MLLAIQNVHPQVMKNARFNLLLLIYILINTINNFTAIRLRLSEIDVLEVVILLLTHLKKYMSQTKQKT